MPPSIASGWARRPPSVRWAMSKSGSSPSSTASWGEWQSGDGATMSVKPPGAEERCSVFGVQSSEPNTEHRTPNTEHLKKRRGLSNLERQHLRNGLLFCSPWLIGFSVFLLYPIIASFYYSLTEFSVLQSPTFIGMANYRELAQDNVFWQSIGNTFYYAAFALPFGMFVALSIAMLLNTDVKGMAVYRTIYFLPSLVPTVATAILWLWIFNVEYGIL